MKKINLIYWDGDNFGDALSPLLVEELSGLSTRHKLSPLSKYNVRVLFKRLGGFEFHRLKSLLFPWERTLLCVGSVMSWGKARSTVWGAGFMNHSDSFRGGKTLAVRGKLTDKKLRKDGFPGCGVYGDPALLLPLWIKQGTRKEYKLGIVPHWHEVDFFKEQYGSQHHIIDLRTCDVKRVVSEIRACEHILSTSLHGLIVAQAYSIPALWIRKGHIDTDGFKFHDYFSSVGIPAYNGFSNIAEILNNEEGWRELFRLNADRTVIRTSLAELQRSLLRCAPFPLKEKYQKLIS